MKNKKPHMGAQHPDMGLLDTFLYLVFGNGKAFLKGNGKENDDENQTDKPEGSGTKGSEGDSPHP